MDEWGDAMRSRYQRVRTLGSGAFGEVRRGPAARRRTRRSPASARAAPWAPACARPTPATATPAPAARRPQVCLALERATGRHVAVKRAFLRGSSGGGGSGCCAALREAAALRAVRHPNVVRLIEAVAEVRLEGAAVRWGPGPLAAARPWAGAGEGAKGRSRS
jgi:serine/threonine protein kinase